MYAKVAILSYQDVHNAIKSIQKYIMLSRAFMLQTASKYLEPTYPILIYFNCVRFGLH